MKPHEQTLMVMQFDKERRCLVEGGQRMVAVLRNYDSAEWEQFLTAAPEMARALVELLARIEREGPADVADPLYDAGREALQKAGVL